jgi:hypothetical protein
MHSRLTTPFHIQGSKWGFNAAEVRELQQKNGVVFEKSDLASGVMGTQI